MKLSPPIALSHEHQLNDFDSGKVALDSWLNKHAMQAQGAGSARTFVVCDGDTIAGYYSLTTGQIDSIEATERARRGMGQYPIPLIILTRLAVDMRYQGIGLGSSLLLDAVKRTLTIAQDVGIRALLTHPIDSDAANFYLRFGFEPTPLGESSLILLLKDARKLV